MYGKTFRGNLGFLALTASLSLVLMGASECDAGPNINDPSDGTAQCVVASRDNMPNGTLNITVDCNGGGEGLGEGNIYAFTSQGDYPMCRTGAAWPGCKQG